MKYITSFEDDFGLPFTPPVITLLQLNYKLRLIKKRGIEYFIHKAKKQADHFRKLTVYIGTNLSNCGTTIKFLKDDINIKNLFRYLQTKNIYITPLGNNSIQISHIGDLTFKDNIVLINEIEKWLKKR